MLEGALEKRYAGRGTGAGSVVIEYLRDPDSAPCRAELDMCREIRNLLSHNADADGAAVVEPSAAVVRMLEDIIAYVRLPLLAIECGTPAEKILFAHPNDAALDVIRHMLRRGYSHVPVRDRSGLVGVFSADSVMHYIGDTGFDGPGNTLRVGDLKGALDIGGERSGRYLFLDPGATLTTARLAFDSHRERNSRVAAIFITVDGTQNSQVLAMLTPWDVLKSDE